ncbi:hypothetical protein [Mycobacterium neumannii]
MQSNDLFSHPQQPEYVSSEDHTNEPVSNPVFSDRSERGPSTPSA